MLRRRLLVSFGRARHAATNKRRVGIRSQEVVVPSEFADEEPIFRSVGCWETYRSADVPGFEAEFHQQWQDLEVTDASVSRETLSKATQMPSPNELSEVLSRVENTPREGSFFLECILQLQGITVPDAFKWISTQLNLPIDSITSSIRPWNKCSAFRIRIPRGSHEVVNELNTVACQPNGEKIIFSHFSYVASPFSANEPVASRYSVVLRGISSPRQRVQQAVEALQLRGFPNFFGPECFHWFHGKDSAVFALLAQKGVAFALRFLDYTGEGRTLRDLLQRVKLYPEEDREAFRSTVVDICQRAKFSPKAIEDTGCFPFRDLSFSPCDRRQDFLELKMSEAVLRSPDICQRLCAQIAAYFWNQVLSLRFVNMGFKVRNGDFVVPRLAQETVSDTHWRGICQTVTKENVSLFTPFDIVHPSFTFNATALPSNRVSSIYHEVCSRYGLLWELNMDKKCRPEFKKMPPLRPIVAKPTELNWSLDELHQTLKLEFVLQPSVSVSAALTELLKTERPVGIENISLLPLHPSLWEEGEPDPRYVEPLDSVYRVQEKDYYGNEIPSRDPVEPEDAVPVDIFSYEGSLAVVTDDPDEKIRQWSETHLVRNGRIPEKNEQRLRDELFEPGLSATMSSAELAQYVEGHLIPLRPNDDPMLIQKLVKDRAKAIGTGVPKFQAPLLRREPQTRLQKASAVSYLTKDGWNRVPL